MTEFQPEQKQMDSYTLDDDAELTGRLIARFTFKHTEQPVASWVEMFQKVIQILYAEDKAIITKLALSEETILLYILVQSQIPLPKVWKLAMASMYGRIPAHKASRLC